MQGQNPKNQEIIRALRKFVKRIQPKLSEAVKWGNGCWIGSNGPVAYVYSDTGYVQFGFFAALLRQAARARDGRATAHATGHGD